MFRHRIPAPEGPGKSLSNCQIRGQSQQWNQWSEKQAKR